MNEVAIRVEKLSKQFRIGAAMKNRNFREALVDGLKAPWRRAAALLRRGAKGAGELPETIWALRDVSFTIQRGEAVGVIGRNGAGKSTLLKILSHITEPTAGFAEIHGRVGSLLEVGTGFHAELTGRENIYLNGAILGMKKAEIRRKFDEIVAFAEVHRFIDTPVKHYSSGMYLRLAFAVAAHLEPEILIVDEVLAVGDSLFQRKCLNKMQDIGKGGRTVLFVSHNMDAITRLCGRAILLEEGVVSLDGPSGQVVGSYALDRHGSRPFREWPEAHAAPGGEVARLRGVRVKTEEGLVTEAVDIRRPVMLEMEYEVMKSDYMLLPNYHLFNEKGVHVFSALDSDPKWRGRPRPAGRYVSQVLIPGNFLSEGTHFVGVALGTIDPWISQFYVQEAVVFHVQDSFEGDSARGDYAGGMGGAVRPLLPWTTFFRPGDEGENGQEPSPAPWEAMARL